MLSSRSKVLVIEDEADVRDLIVLHLKREGHEVLAVEDGETGIQALESGSFDLAIVDWMLPGMSGLEVTRWLSRSKGRMPVLMVTARADSADIVRGLEGADDYVTKPFDFQVLLARVRALLRRASHPVAQNNRIVIGDLVLDPETHEVQAGGEKLRLTLSEFKLLQALMRNSGKVLSRDKLIELVQGEGVSVVDRAIDTHVFGLRKKMGAHADFIETIRGVGYRMRGAIP